MGASHYTLSCTHQHHHPNSDHEYNNLYRCSIIETVSTIENPKAVKAARLNLVVKALLPQFSHHVICAKLVTSLK